MILQAFPSSYGSRRFVHVTRVLIAGFFHPDRFLVDLGVYVWLWLIVLNLYFWLAKLINNFNVFNNIKITLYSSVCMRTSGEKVRISDKAERVQSFSYPQIRPFSR